MEIIVAMGVLVVIAAAAGSMLIQSLGDAGSNRMRVRAANLAAQEIELVRAELQTAPAAIDLDLTSHPAVGGTTFTVVRKGEWQDSEPADAVAELDALNITVTVTWPRMGGIKPVVSSSVLTSTADSLEEVVDIETPPTVAPDPVVTEPTECLPDLSPLATVGIGVSTKFTVDDLTTLVDLEVGTVTANRLASGACEAMMKTFPIVNGVGVGSLPYGDWTFTVTTPSTATSVSGSWPTVSLQSGVTTPVNLQVLGNCTDTSGLVTLTVNSQTTLAGLTVSLPLAAGTVTAFRPADGPCRPAKTILLPVVAGLATGTLPYGDWTFSVTSPTASTSVTGSWPTKTISSALAVSVPINIVGSCPTSTALVTVNVDDASSILPPTGWTVTASRPASLGCAAKTITVGTTVAGAVVKAMEGGTWTFTVNGKTLPSGSSWPTVNITGVATVAVTAK